MSTGIRTIMFSWILFSCEFYIKYICTGNKESEVLLMTALNHRDYNNELENLHTVMDYLKAYREKILKQKLRIDKDVDYGIRHFNSDNAEQFNELIINTSIQESILEKLKTADKSLSKPYFARVDFKEEQKSKLEEIYIGKMSLMREENQEILITDWRAPIANLYYEGRLGNAVYHCPDGEVEGQITLKRQYIIENAALKEIYDIDITTNDDFLQASLGSSKDNRLKDIVSTIQAEQNRVIRAEMWKPLIVQGAAGGGKTTIALHRIAYLLYNNENTLLPKNFMIIAPNRFFLSYISEVLPDLGVENVLQTTFEDLSLNIIGTKLKVMPSSEKLSFFIENNSIHSQYTIDALKYISKFKSSLAFMKIIRKHVRNIEQKFLPKIDFSIGSTSLFTYNELQRLFLQEYNYLPLVKRINEIKKNLVNTLKREKGPLLEKVEREYDAKINKIRDSMKDCPERRQRIIKLAEERDSLLDKIRRQSKVIVKEYLDRIKPLSSIEYYKSLISDQKSFIHCCKSLGETDDYEAVRVYTENIIKEGYVEAEDLAPLLYIEYHIFGLEEKFSVKHVIIDEAQDYSLFQFYVLKQIIGSSSFTILGDLFQGIHSYKGITSWSEVEKFIFPDSNASYLTLEQSYRTTVEIMEAANRVIKSLKSIELPLAKPVIRHGEPVEIREMKDMKALARVIADKIGEIMEQGYKSAAVICKTLAEGKKLQAELRKIKLQVDLITGSEKEFNGGVVIVPSYLVKGLEFDAVIVANAGKEVYKTNELDIKLLYVAMTRPLHRLYIYSIGEISKLLL